jgi:hypothetical protein
VTEHLVQGVADVGIQVVTGVEPLKYVARALALLAIHRFQLRFK